MIQNANQLGFALVLFLLILYVAILMALISFYRRQQKLIENARNEAEIASKAKTSFLFNMSHDIRTPMNAVIGFTDRAIRHKDDPEILTDSLEKVQSSSNYLLRIINDILDMAKIESGKLELKESVHRTEMGKHPLLGIFVDEAARKDIKLHVSYDGIKDKYVWIDESRVDQIFANILSNAIKYTGPGGEIWSDVRQVPCDRTGYARTVATVKDSGKGMSQEFLERIYDVFEREQSATASGAQGTGLGMAIVKNLVDAMDGTIEIQSEQGVGTTVILTMDNRIATNDEIREYLSSGNISDGEEHSRIAGKRILLVEDNELNRELATELLEEQGLIVETASDGDIAVEMCKAILDRQDPLYYAAALMDIQMPRMNGFEATRQIRALLDASGTHMPIIAMTANAFEEDRKAALDAGMDEHIAKPIDVDNLLRVLSKII